MVAAQIRVDEDYASGAARGDSKGRAVSESARQTCFAVADQVAWPLVEAEIHRRDQANPLIELTETYQRILREVKARQEEASTDVS
jgi:hypothetical protein